MRRIYLDLDNTLIDSVRRYEDEQATAERYGIPRADYVVAVETLYARHGTAAYSLSLVLTILRETRPDLSRAFEEDLWALLRRQYFFPDTIPFLAQFPREELVVVTEGAHEFQWSKVQAHELLNYVGDVKVIRGKKSDAIVEDGARTFFLDDAARHVDEVKQARPSVVAIQVRAPAPWEKKQASVLADFSCASLAEAAEFIESRSI